MKKSVSILSAIIIVAIFPIGGNAQQRRVLPDISHEQKSEYTRVNRNLFEQYHEIVENKIGASLIINESEELDCKLLTNIDAVIILSPLNKETLKNLTSTERESIANYIKNGGSVVLFADEDKRMNIEEFGGNDIVKPFGMQYGGELPYISNVSATSFVGKVIKDKYELPYSGSCELTGGIPLSVRNTEGGFVHGAYAELDNGGKIAAFGETMVGLFMGGIEVKGPDGSTIAWRGKDDKQFMLELISWMFED